MPARGRGPSPRPSARPRTPRRPPSRPHPRPEPAPEPAPEPEPQPAPEPPAPEPQPEPPAPEPQPEQPKAEEPKAEEPKAEEPKAEEPKAEEPKAEEPKAEEPKAEEPKAEEPKAEEPKAEEPKAEEPKAEEPDRGAVRRRRARRRRARRPGRRGRVGPRRPAAPADPAAPPPRPADPAAPVESTPGSGRGRAAGRGEPARAARRVYRDPAAPGWTWSGDTGRSALEGLVSRDGRNYPLNRGNTVGSGLAAGDPTTDEGPTGGGYGGTPSFGGWNVAGLQRYVPAAPPPAPLPDTRLLSPEQAEALRTVALRERVGWTVLAAAAQARGALAGATSEPTSDLSKLAGQLRDLGARADASRPFAVAGGARQPARLARRPGSAPPPSPRTTTRSASSACATACSPRSPTSSSPSWPTATSRSTPGGRNDIASHRVDPRILMTLRLLEARFGSVGVSCLISGHPIFTTSGNVSAHIFGRAVDVSHLGGENVTGNMGPDSRTEKAVRLLLMLPNEVEARQIISLMDLDGPTGNTGSFAMADHNDHIHVGF